MPCLPFPLPYAHVDTRPPKFSIARTYLEPDAQEACGIPKGGASITDDALRQLIHEYCREAGVRNLKNKIEKVYRKAALEIVRAFEESKGDDKEGEQVGEGNGKEDGAFKDAEAGAKGDFLGEGVGEGVGEGEGVGNGPHTPSAPIEILPENLPDYVGPPAFTTERIWEETPVGVTMGLAWTAMGGSTLYIEASVTERGEGKGAIATTGSLGDVMKESALIAHACARDLLHTLDPLNDFFDRSRIHLHVPAGATPKDGPSAGCTMITSLLSLALGRAVAPDLAMTGEVTLTGRVLPVGGIKEKVIAARRSGVKTIILPMENRRDFDVLADEIKEGIAVHFVDTYESIKPLAFP